MIIKLNKDICRKCILKKSSNKAVNVTIAYQSDISDNCYVFYEVGIQKTVREKHCRYCRYILEHMLIKER